MEPHSKGSALARARVRAGKPAPSSAVSPTFRADRKPALPRHSYRREAASGGLIALSARCLERIDQLHAPAVKVLDVAGDDDEAMHMRGSGEAGIINMLFAGAERLAPRRGDVSINGQYPALETIEDRRYGRVQRRRHVGLRLPQLGDALGDFTHRQRADRKIGVVDTLQPGRDILVR